MKRIVLYGPPIAGKTTLLKAIATAHFALVETFFEHSLDDERLTCRGARTQFPQSSSMIEVATLCGPQQNDGIWRALLHDAVAVVLVLDGQRERDEANRAWVANLARNQTPITGCIVVTKLDLPHTTFAPAQLVAGTRFASWPTAQTRGSNATSATRAIDALILDL